MTSLCKLIVRIVGALYLFALALLLIGTFGLFGQERDPLAGVFLVPLGLPWVLWLESFSDEVRPWLAALAPLLNLVFLAVVCRLLSRPGASRK